MDTTKIYIDIDSLLDTRYGKLSYQMEEDKLIEYVCSIDYNNRDTDIFPVDMDVYNSTPKDKELITRSIVSHIIVQLKQKIIMLEKKHRYMNKIRAEEIILNVYPYNLTEHEKDILRDVLFTKLGVNVFITVIDVPNSEISPRYLKGNEIDYSFIYDSTEWLNNHLPTLSNTPFPELTIYVPALSKKPIQPDQLKEISDKGFNSIFTFLEYVLSKAIKIHFLPVFFYTNTITASVYTEKCIEINQTRNLNDLADRERNENVII